MIKDCFIDLNESNLVEQFLTFTVSKASKSLIARFVHTDTTLLSHAAMKSDPINIFMTQIILRRNHTTITINADNKDTDIDDILIKEFFQHVVWQNQEKLKIIEFLAKTWMIFHFYKILFNKCQKSPKACPKRTVY
ncbi:MAG: hypothetical protein HWD59_04955 [Coxiellaceae bacterium]|nr:MAG: hypothetical protein HWD59_04955 [Coxiellaceae bacterium]